MFDAQVNPPSNRGDVTLFTYAMMNNSIHHMVFKASSQSSIRDWLRYLDAIYRHGSNQTVLTLTDARSSVIPSLSYVSHLSQFWVSERHSHLNSRNAILHRDAPLSPVAEDVVTSLTGEGHNAIRFFPVDNRSAAVRWLIARD